MRKHIFLKSLLRQPALLTWLLGRRQRHRIELGLAPPKTASGTANGWVSASGVADRQQQEWWQQAELVTSGGHLGCVCAFPLVYYRHSPRGSLEVTTANCSAAPLAMPVDAGSGQSDLAGDDEVTSDEEEEDSELLGVQEVAEQEDLRIEREYQVAAPLITTTILLLCMPCSIVQRLGMSSASSWDQHSFITCSGTSHQNVGLSHSESAR